MAWLRKYLKDSKEAKTFSKEQIRAESNIGINFLSIVSAWASLAKDSRNKNDWNNFAKYVLTEVESFDKIIQEVKNE